MAAIQSRASTQSRRTLLSAIDLPGGVLAPAGALLALRALAHSAIRAGLAARGHGRVELRVLPDGHARFADATQHMGELIDFLDRALARR